MPKYYCDYCDTYLTHDSPSVRRTHNQGRNHKENVRKYYQDWLEEQAQKLIDTTTAAFKAGKLPLGAARAALANSIIRPALPLSSPFFMPPPQAIGPAGVNPVLAGPNPFFPVPPPGPMAQSPFFSQGVPPHPPQAQFMFAPPAIAGFHPQGPPPPMTGFAPQGPPPNLTGFHHQGPPPPIPGFHPQGPPPPITGFHPQGPPPPIPGFHPQRPYPPPQGFPVSTTNSDGQSMFSPPPPFPPPPTLNIPPPNLPQPPPHLRKPPPPTSQSMNPGQQQ